MWMRHDGTAIKDIGYFLGNAVGGHLKRFIDMNVALSHTTRGMTKQGRDGQLGKTAIAIMPRSA